MLAHSKNNLVMKSCHFATTWMEPESVMLNEIVRERQTPYDFTHMCDLRDKMNKGEKKTKAWSTLALVVWEGNKVSRECRAGDIWTECWKINRLSTFGRWVRWEWQRFKNRTAKSDTQSCKNMLQFENQRGQSTLDHVEHGEGRAGWGRVGREC